jgi:ribose transport system ATP-binding protein
VSEAAPAGELALLIIRDVRKAFGPTQALGGVSLSAEAGQVHALIGENGAGKSTLMNVLAGVMKPDSGEILLEGKPYRPSGPVEARAAGVAMVHQELSLCPHLTVAENIALGNEPSRFGIVQGKKMRAFAQAALAQVADPSHHALRPETRVSLLSPAEQQLVEIARAVSVASCRVLILDEPTSSLAREDVERLFGVIRTLRAQGMTIIYISHFLEEVERIADAFTVIRDGKTVGSGLMKGIKRSEIVSMMAGREVEQLFPRSARTSGEVVVSLENLAGVEKPSSASLELRRGEVLGIAGLIGAGRTELLRAVYGLDAVRSGRVKLLGLEGPASPARRWAQGVGMVSEDRKQEGLATGLSVADNLTLSKLRGLGPRGFVLPKRQSEAAARWMERLKIKARDPEQPVRELSGGNQQKIALARLLYHDVDVILLDEPTRGIDVGSKAQIYELIDQLAASGKAVLMVSSYLPELLGVCDRIAVMRRGRLGEARPVAELTEHSVLSEAVAS